MKSKLLMGGALCLPLLLLGCYGVEWQNNAGVRLNSKHADFSVDDNRGGVLLGEGDPVLLAKYGLAELYLRSQVLPDGTRAPVSAFETLHKIYIDARGGYGTAFEKYFQRAYNAFLELANQNDLKAQYDLAVYFYKAGDVNQARLWASRAAGLGLPEAKKLLEMVGG